MIFLTSTKRPRAHCSPVTHGVLAGHRLFEWDMGWVEGRIGILVSLWQSSWVFVNFGKSEKWPLHKLVYKGRGGAFKDQDNQS